MGQTEKSKLMDIDTLKGMKEIQQWECKCVKHEVIRGSPSGEKLHKYKDSKPLDSVAVYFLSAVGRQLLDLVGVTGYTQTSELWSNSIFQNPQLMEKIKVIWTSIIMLKKEIIMNLTI